jgi:hypothetical protein
MDIELEERHRPSLDLLIRDDRCGVVNVREVIKTIESDGWSRVDSVGVTANITTRLKMDA